MKLRKIVSLTAMLAFVVLVISSVILFIVPYGRVAYWADWHLWGLSKTQWGNVHINTGVIFLLAMGLHIYLNWKPLVSYLKDRARRLRIFTPDFNLALVLVVAVVAGTLAQVPPFSSMIALNTAIKDAAARKYGEPPYGHAELSSLKNFATKVGLDANQALRRLMEAGLKVEGLDQNLQQIGRQNNLAPQQVYQIMLAGGNQQEPGSAAGKLPEQPPAGIGRQTLQSICRTYGLDLQALIRQMKASGIQVSGGKTIKELADELGISPQDLYLELHRASVEMSR